MIYFPCYLITIHYKISFIRMIRSIEIFSFRIIFNYSINFGNFWKCFRIFISKFGMKRSIAISKE